MNRVRYIARRDVIRGVLSRWDEQYARFSPDYKIGTPSEPIRLIRERIAALDLETATVADVDAAMGTTGWASLTCDLCGDDVEHIHRLGDEPDYDNQWIDICDKCVRSLYDRVEQHKDE